MGFTPNFLEILQMRRDWHEILKVLRKVWHQPRIVLHSVTLTLKSVSCGEERRQE